MAGVPVATANGSNAYAHLMDPKRTWYNNRRLLAPNGWIVLLLITSSTNGYDGSMMNGLQSLTQWEDYFNYPRGGTLGLFNAIQNIGALAAYPFAPYLSDGIGRRMTVLLGASIMCIATAVQTASQSFGMFIGARLLIGFGLTFAANAAPMLVAEISYPKYRATLTSTYNSLWYSGAIGIIIPLAHRYASRGRSSPVGTWPRLLCVASRPNLVVFRAPVVLPACVSDPREVVWRERAACALAVCRAFHARVLISTRAVRLTRAQDVRVLPAVLAARNSSVRFSTLIYCIPFIQTHRGNSLIARQGNSFIPAIFSFATAPDS
ncbi:hypothetical protein C8J57DRAFT_1568496 [Mycena rebaudengoi]|nr:hypothetical protein C8J57DRAFT_1568496 [Mycena rebaudengoi]